MTYRTRNRRRVVSASLFALAAARVAAAQSVPSTYEPGTPSTTPAPANPYAASQTFPATAANLVGTNTSLTLNGVLANGGFVVTDTGSGSTLVYAYAANNSTPVATGPTTGDFVNVNGVSNQSYRAANFGGSVFGQSSRYIPGTTATAGTDAYLYVPPVGAATGTPIVLGTQGVLGAVNSTGTANGTIYYNYAVSTTVSGTTFTGTFRGLAAIASTNGVTSAPASINANNQVILTANRYTGLAGQTLALGSDAFLFTPSADGSATGTPTRVGLTGAPYYYYSQQTITNVGGSTSANAAAYQTSTSTPLALNATGEVIGTTIRYLPNTPASGYTSGIGTVPGLGTDAWVYSGATALGTTGGTAPIGTTQVGLVGTTTPAAQGGYYSAQVSNGGIYQVSAVAGISAAGAVTGTSTVYAANTSAGTTPVSLGANDAWQFKPTLAGGPTLTTATAPGFGTTTAGTYVQLGLTAAPSGTTVGYVSTATNAGARNQTISATNAAGNVAGTTVRYFAGSTSSSGSDAWYYNGSGGAYLITPTANPAYSTYVASSNSSSSSVNATMSAQGVVAGTQNRFLVGTTTSAGSEVFAYSPATNTTAVIASPALIANDADFAANASAGTAAEYFNGAVKSVGDNGLVIGTFTAYNGSTTATPSLGSYVFAWTQQAGTVVIGSTTSTSSVVAALTLNASSGTTNINVGNIYADAAGNIFGVGSGTAPTIYEFAAAPEPTSLALLALSLAPFAGRRRRAGRRC